LKKIKPTIPLLTILFILACSGRNSQPIVTSFAGNGKMGKVDGLLHEASFANPMGIAADQKGNLYISDSHNNLIRKIGIDGLVSTVAGSGEPGSFDGKGIRASFFYPVSVCTDKKGNVFISDTHNNLIRKIDSAGNTTTIAGARSGQQNVVADSLDVRLDNPAGICVDDHDNLYIADWANNVIRKISPEGQSIILAGSVGNRGAVDGAGSEASFYLPWGIVPDSINNIYVSDFRNNMIRKISPQGKVTTFAGSTTRGSSDGLGKAASFFHPAGISIDKNGNLYVADSGNNKIRKITPDGMVTTLAGNGLRGAQNGPAMQASFYKPYALAIGPDGSLFVADYQNNLIRKISF
jgi:sugar lactone lactonase YvrE